MKSIQRDLEPFYVRSLFHHSIHPHLPSVHTITVFLMAQFLTDIGVMVIEKHARNLVNHHEKRHG